MGDLNGRAEWGGKPQSSHHIQAVHSRRIRHMRTHAPRAHGPSRALAHTASAWILTPSHTLARTRHVYTNQTHTHAPIPSVCFFPSSGVLPDFFPFLGTFLGTAEHIDATAAENKDGVGELVAQKPRLQRSRLRVEHIFIRASSVDDDCVCTLPQLSGSAGALPKATRQSQQRAKVGVRRWGGKPCEEDVGELCAGGVLGHGRHAHSSSCRASEGAPRRRWNRSSPQPWPTPAGGVEVGEGWVEVGGALDAPAHAKHTRATPMRHVPSTEERSTGSAWSPNSRLTKSGKCQPPLFRRK